MYFPNGYGDNTVGFYRHGRSPTSYKDTERVQRGDLRGQVDLVWMSLRDYSFLVKTIQTQGLSLFRSPFLPLSVDLKSTLSCYLLPLYSYPSYTLHSSFWQGLGRPTHRLRHSNYLLFYHLQEGQVVPPVFRLTPQKFPLPSTRTSPDLWWTETISMNLLYLIWIFLVSTCPVRNRVPSPCSSRYGL